MKGVPGSARCGTSSGYSRHMKTDRSPCKPCRQARDRYNKQLRYRRHLAGGSVSVDATGTRRRVQALAAIGWRMTDIGVLIGVGPSVVREYTTATFVHQTTADKVRVVYDKLSGTVGPSNVTRSRAVAAGWAPPLAYDEGAIDDPRAVSHTEVEAAHAEALREHKLRVKRVDKKAQLQRLRQDPARSAAYTAHRTAYRREYRHREREAA